MNNHYYKQFVSSTLALALMVSAAAPAFAADKQVIADSQGHGEGFSDVTLEVKEAAPDVMIATVPVELPIVMDTKGNVAVSTNARIMNQSTKRGIQVSKVSTTLAEGWEAADYSDDFSEKETDTKEVGLALRGDTMSTDGSFNMTTDNWNIGKGGTLKLNMGAKLPLQSKTEKTKIATIGFTLDWKDGDVATSNPSAGVSDIGSIEDGSDTGITEDGENPSNALSMTEADAKAAGYSFSTYGNGLQITNFTNTDGATVINVPERIGGLKVLRIDNNAFSYNSSARPKLKNVTSVSLPDSVREIGESAFQFDANLTSINFPSNLEIIGNYAFAQCNSLTKAVLLDGLWKIDDAAFQSCSLLKTIRLPNSLTHLGNRVFNNCVNLTSVTIPGRVTIMGDSIFEGDISLKEATLNNGLRYTGSGMFKNCTNLQSIELPETLSNISYGTFNNCTSLRTIMLPAATTTFTYGNSSYGSPFDGCYALTNIYSRAANGSINEGYLGAPNATVTYLAVS